MEKEFDELRLRTLHLFRMKNLIVCKIFKKKKNCILPCLFFCKTWSNLKTFSVDGKILLTFYPKKKKRVLPCTWRLDHRFGGWQGVLWWVGGTSFGGLCLKFFFDRKHLKIFSNVKYFDRKHFTMKRKVNV